MSGIHRLRKVLRHTGLHHELTHRPPGKRSVAVAKKGRAVQRSHGTRRPLACGREKRFTRKPDKVSPHLKPSRSIPERDAPIFVWEMECFSKKIPSKEEYNGYSLMNGKEGGPSFPMRDFRPDAHEDPVD